MPGHSASKDARKRAYDPGHPSKKELHWRGWIATELGLARVPQLEAPQVGQARLAVSSPAMTVDGLYITAGAAGPSRAPAAGRADRARWSCSRARARVRSARRISPRLAPAS